ncbi:hypothetical protein Ccar_25050 [Clostridium carboxidivorans P7]|nr:flagellar protein FliT [Clostridium carboxidivorans]AKN33918.1 hypothetical protein Ccar_25050 [Clostridium carboxidivorans P7]EFG88211.1 hypothetical protein CLCAR_2204 [Clostridium carboxidivorans P7]
MENELEKGLREYRECTIELIECLEKEDYDSLEYFFNKRQQILDELSNSNYTKEEFYRVSQELELLVYHKKLNDLMIEKRDKVKQQINRLAKNKNASNMYNRRGYGAKIFSKKI